MNKKNYLIEKILTLDPVTEVIKSMKFAQILFNLDDDSAEKYASENQSLNEIESDVLKGLNLDLCFEIFHAYKTYNFKNIINHKTKRGTVLKIPLYELRAAIRKVYFGIVELIFTSDIISGDFGIGDSGNKITQEDVENEL